MATKAIYTMLFEKVLLDFDFNEWWEQWSPFGQSEKGVQRNLMFKDRLSRRWDYHEIFTDDLDEFRIRLDNFVRLRVAEWRSKLDMYEIEIDPMDGISVTTDQSEDAQSFGYPNKSVASIKPDGYQTSGSKGSGHSKATGHVNVVSQRELAIRAVRNLMSDFADECSPLFVELYS